MAPLRAFGSGKATGEDGAFDVAAELPLDEARHRVCVEVSSAAQRQIGLQVLSDHPVEHALGGAPGPIERRSPRGAARCQDTALRAAFPSALRWGPEGRRARGTGSGRRSPLRSTPAWALRRGVPPTAPPYRRRGRLWPRHRGILSRFWSSTPHDAAPGQRPSPARHPFQGMSRTITPPLRRAC